MKILLTGKDGQVGFELQRALAPLGEVYSSSSKKCDLSNPNAIRKLLRQVKPDIIVNPAAYTAVDQAESDIQLAESVNAVCPGVIGEEAAKSGAFVVHYSTDYVFDGLKPQPYIESDTPNPLNVYGRSKVLGEQLLQSSGAKALILRTSWVAGSHGKNFVKTILRLASEKDQISVVSDQTGSPTTASLLADTTAHLIRQYLREGAKSFPYGTYHLTASGKTSWFDYARFILNQANAFGLSTRLKAENIKPVTSKDYPTQALRPSNSCLDCGLAEKTFGFELPDWKSGITHLLLEILND
jgi:dTDP-4-dehydrorhamnose reductase